MMPPVIGKFLAWFESLDHQEQSDFLMCLGHYIEYRMGDISTMIDHLEGGKE